MDVKSAFLNGYVDEEIYVEQPEGFDVLGREDKDYRLKKSLYGLKQGPRAWYSRIDKYFQDYGLIKSLSDPNIYILQSGQDILIVALYVDDLIYIGNNVELFQKFKSHMIAEFEMTDLGELHYFLGIEVWQKEDGILMSQGKYTLDILKKFRMTSCKLETTPLEVGLKLYGHDESKSVDITLYRQLVGSLIYLTTTRPDISFAVSIVSRFMSNPKEIHWKEAMRILRYLHSTIGYGLIYRSTEDFRLIGYTDSDWVGCMDDRKSTSRYSFSMGSAAVAWSTKKQPTVSLSTTEAEYKATYSVDM
jgi:hypothetical protein